jgi:hypothetical protein
MNITPKIFIFRVFLLTILLSAVVSVYAYFIVGKYNSSHHRIIDPRSTIYTMSTMDPGATINPKPIKGYNASGLIDDHVGVISEGGLDVALFGDSQTKGFRLGEEFTISGYLEKRYDCKVMNFGFRDGRILDAITLLDFISDIKVGSITFNISLPSIKKSEERHLNVNILGRGSYYQYIKEFLINPGLFPAVINDETQWEGTRYKPQSWLVGMKEGYLKYTDDQLDEYFKKLLTFNDKAKSKADNVIFYISPLELKSVALSGQGEQYIGDFNKKVLDLCSANGLSCFDFQKYFKKKNFHDIIHLNRSGSRTLATLIERYSSPSICEG